jgi:hypothetical protein
MGSEMVQAGLLEFGDDVDLFGTVARRRPDGAEGLACPMKP